MTIVNARRAAEAAGEIRVAWEQEVAELPPGPLRPIEGVVLTPAQAPRTTRIAAEASTRLGISPPTTVLCAASTAARGDEHAWSLYVAPPDIAGLDDAALAALVGHAFASATWTIPTRPFRFDGPGMTVEAFFALARFLGADRFALVAAGGDVEAFARFVLARERDDRPIPHVGIARLLDALDETTLTSPLAPLLAEPAMGVPSLALRLYAAKRFVTTRLASELTGRGAGSLDVRELDASLKALVTRRHGYFPAPRVEGIRPTRVTLATTGSAPGYGLRGAYGDALGPETVNVEGETRRG